MVDARLTLALAAALAIAPAAGGASRPGPRVDPAIARVERGLAPAVAIAGRPVPTRGIAAEMARLGVPGASVAVLRGGAIAWAKGYGVAFAGGPAVTPATLFQAGSISKPVTALAALRLVDRGVLTLDRPVDERLRGWRLGGAGGDRVTLRQLLNHTAGTTVHGFPGYVRGAPLPDVVAVLSGRPPASTPPVVVDTPPGTAWRYSGGGYTVIQKLIGDATGRPFAEVLRDEVLAPAGMAASRFEQSLPPALLAGAALPHDAEGRPLPGGPHNYPELAAAGLWTTPSDLARYAIAVRAAALGQPGAPLAPATAAAMLTPGKGGYGLGLEVAGPAADRRFAHGGSNAGYESLLVAYAGSGDGAVVMTNGARGNELATEIARAVAAAYGWPSYRSIVRPSVPIPAATARALAGAYAIPGLGTFAIAARPGGLTLSLKEGAGEPLYAMGGDRYFILSQDMVLTFARGAGPLRGRIVSGPFDLAFARVP